MKFYKFSLLIFFVCSVPLFAQDSERTSRTPEQEAARQTERLKQELSLTPEQIREVYKINLRHAQQRQISNSRAEAMERIRSKNADLKLVLTEEQFERLQNKHHERSTIRTQSGNRRSEQSTE